MPQIAIAGYSESYSGRFKTLVRPVHILLLDQLPEHPRGAEGHACQRQRQQGPMDYVQVSIITL